jgi:choline monooxygenase
MNRRNLPDFTPKELRIEPLERAETIPSSWYTEPQVHEVDKQLIFSKTWQYVGSLDFIKHVGDYFTTMVADNPIIVIRGKDNAVRAFFNVCRHRGGPLSMEEAGNCSMLQCKYHGWTYTLDGMLRGVPKFDRTQLFDKKDYGLVPVALSEWEGLLFINLSKKNTPLSTIIQGITERIAPHRISSKKFFKRFTYEINCNWKVYVDNYLEGYHVPLVHPKLAKLLDYQNYVTETFKHYSLQYSPLTEKDNIYGAGSALYYFIFPNFMLNILPGRLQTNLVIALSHNKTLVVFDYYYDDITSSEALKRIQDDIEYSEKVQQEDIEICERVQKGLESIAYHKGRFSVEMEQGVYHFQCLLKKAYRELL